MLTHGADMHLFWLQTWLPFLDLLDLGQLCFLSLILPIGFPFSLFVGSSTELLTFSVILMEENAEALSDGSEPFRVRRYRKQHQDVPPPTPSALHLASAAEGSPAGSDYFPVHEVPEEVGLLDDSEALCISHDSFIPAAQSDENLFDNLDLDAFSEVPPDSSALPLQDQVPSSARCLVQHDSRATLSGAFHSAELASTVPFSVVMGPPSSEQNTQTEVSGALLRSAWLTGKSSSRSRSRGPSLNLDPGVPKPPPIHPLRATGASILESSSSTSSF